MTVRNLNKLHKTFTTLFKINLRCRAESLPWIFNCFLFNFYVHFSYVSTVKRYSLAALLFDYLRPSHINCYTFYLFGPVLLFSNSYFYSPYFYCFPYSLPSRSLRRNRGLRSGRQTRTRLLLNLSPFCQPLQGMVRIRGKLFALLLVILEFYEVFRAFLREIISGLVFGMFTRWTKSSFFTWPGITGRGFYNSPIMKFLEF